jgi:hypothetical protein
VFVAVLAVVVLAVVVVVSVVPLVNVVVVTVTVVVEVTSLQLGYDPAIVPFGKHVQISAAPS